MLHDLLWDPCEFHIKMADSSAAEREEEETREHRNCTGLAHAFKILSCASRDRLQSLTSKMASSQDEVLVQAMSMITLNKDQEALDKLQLLSNSKVAKHLAEKMKKHRGSLEEFTEDGEPLPEPQGDALSDVAGIFRVLSKEGLCSKSLWIRAHQSALCVRGVVTTNTSDKGRRSEHSEPPITAAGDVCVLKSRTGSSQLSCPGGETLHSRSVPFNSKGSPAIPIPIPTSRCLLVTGNERSSPSSLRTSFPSESSFPSHLEVSVSPTTVFDSHRTNRDVQDFRLTPLQVSTEDVSHHVSVPLSGVRLNSEPSKEHINRSVTTNPSLTTSTPIPHQAHMPSYSCAKTTSQLVERIEDCETKSAVTSRSADAKGEYNKGSSLKQVAEAPLSSNVFNGNKKPECPNVEVLNTSVTASNKEESQSKGEHGEEEEEAQFFSFVILHAPEDMEIAESLKEKLEGLGIGEGSIFSQNFLVPGKSTLKCIEDAIDNSAFTILLLSRNFNTHLQELQTNAALMNAIENQHKYNSVIPLLPIKNRWPLGSLPRYLKIFVPLDEKSSSFDRMARKALAPEKVKRQRQLWSQEQHIRAQREKQALLREQIKRGKILHRETKEFCQLEMQRMQLLWQQQQVQQMRWNPPQFGVAPNPAPASSWPLPPQHSFNPDWQLNMNAAPGHQQPSIHIENASYIMIGNNSQMSVETCTERSEGDEPIDSVKYT